MEMNLFMNKKNLPVSIIAILSTVDYIPITLKAMTATLRSVRPEYDSYIICPQNSFDTSPLNIRQINIQIDENYSLWILKNLKNYINSEYVLIQQWDSCVINKEKWTDDFLSYDYIGAPWSINNNNSFVGNGGFSLRSSAFIESCSSKEIVETLPVGEFVIGNEDFHACYTSRAILENKYKIKFPTYNLALQFSVERVGPAGFNPSILNSYQSFGFHGNFNSAGMKFIEELECINE